MADIRHRVGIKATPSKVYKAITTLAAYVICGFLTRLEIRGLAVSFCSVFQT